MKRSLPIALSLSMTLFGGCKREIRDLRADPPVSAALNDVKPMANRINGAIPVVTPALGDPYRTMPGSSIRASVSTPGSTARDAMRMAAGASRRP